MNIYENMIFSFLVLTIIFCLYLKKIVGRLRIPFHIPHRISKSVFLDLLKIQVFAYLTGDMTKFKKFITSNRVRNYTPSRDAINDRYNHQKLCLCTRHYVAWNRECHRKNSKLNTSSDQEHELEKITFSWRFMIQKTQFFGEYIHNAIPILITKLFVS